jgi:hypothetical protein
MTRRYQWWTPARTDTLRKLYGVIPTSQLAHVLDTTPAAVRLKAQALGVTRDANVQGRVLALLDEIAILRREVG